MTTLFIKPKRHKDGHTYRVYDCYGQPLDDFRTRHEALVYISECLDPWADISIIALDNIFQVSDNTAQETEQEE